MVIPENLKEFKKRDTVVILGTASSITATPWDMEDTDYWCCQPVLTYDHHKGHRIDAIFEMHPMEKWQMFRDGINEYMKDHDVPVFMLHRVAQINNSVSYPIREVQEMADHPKLRKYFTSTISYMIALAIWMGYSAIELYGVHMSSDEEEYSLQRSCCEAWLNFGLGRGIQYFIPDQSDVMFSNYMYGYEEEKGIFLNIMSRREALSNGVTQLDDKIKQLTKERDMQQGAVMDCDQILRTIRRK